MACGVILSHSLRNYYLYLYSYYITANFSGRFSTTFPAKSVRRILTFREFLQLSLLYCFL